MALAGRLELRQVVHVGVAAPGNLTAAAFATQLRARFSYPKTAAGVLALFSVEPAVLKPLHATAPWNMDGDATGKLLKFDNASQKSEGRGRRHCACACPRARFRLPARRAR